MSPPLRRRKKRKVPSSWEEAGKTRQGLYFHLRSLVTVPGPNPLLSPRMVEALGSLPFYGVCFATKRSLQNELGLKHLRNVALHLRDLEWLGAILACADGPEQSVVYVVFDLSEPAPATLRERVWQLAEPAFLKRMQRGAQVSAIERCGTAALDSKRPCGQAEKRVKGARSSPSDPKGSQRRGGDPQSAIRVELSRTVFRTARECAFEAGLASRRAQELATELVEAAIELGTMPAEMPAALIAAQLARDAATRAEAAALSPRVKQPYVEARKQYQAALRHEQNCAVALRRFIARVPNYAELRANIEARKQGHLQDTDQQDECYSVSVEGDIPHVKLRKDLLRFSMEPLHGQESPN